MNMDTEIINQIVVSLETWVGHPDKVGGEVRPMSDAMIEQNINDIDPIMDALLQIIEQNPNDSDLGKAIRRIYIPLKIIADDKKSPE